MSSYFFMVNKNKKKNIPRKLFYKSHWAWTAFWKKLNSQHFGEEKHKHFYSQDKL